MYCRKALGSFHMEATSAAAQEKRQKEKRDSVIKLSSGGAETSTLTVRRLMSTQ